MIGNVPGFVVVILLLFVSPVLAQEPFYGVVKKVIDGDSLLVISGKKTIEVRLYGVDSPEYSQPFSKKAKDLLRKRVSGKKVLIRPQYFDPYKRLVAIVLYEDQSVNSELVNAGLAWVYPQYCRKDICTSWKEMERSARAAKRGLWTAPKPIPPWQWRNSRSAVPHLRQINLHHGATSRSKDRLNEYGALNKQVHIGVLS